MVAQRMKILDYIKWHGCITARQAFDICKCNSPRKRISELREKGYPIEDRWRQDDETGRRWKEYYLYEQQKKRE